MREASWWKRVQRHELQQLHGREERPPSSQHDHQREEGHRPRRYFANQAAAGICVLGFLGYKLEGTLVLWAWCLGSPLFPMDMPPWEKAAFLSSFQLPFMRIPHVSPAPSDRTQHADCPPGPGTTA